MLPSETELLERDIQNERRARAKARKERFADEPVSTIGELHALPAASVWGLKSAITQSTVLFPHLVCLQVGYDLDFDVVPARSTYAFRERAKQLVSPYAMQHVFHVHGAISRRRATSQNHR